MSNTYKYFIGFSVGFILAVIGCLLSGVTFEQLCGPMTAMNSIYFIIIIIVINFIGLLIVNSKNK